MDYFDYLEPETEDFDIEEFLERSQKSQRAGLEEELERIEDQLEARRKLHEEVIEELESKLDWYTHRLEMMYKRQQGKEGGRTRLKEQIDRFYQEIRGEKQQYWRDKQELERERRQLIRELDELVEEGALWDLISG